MSALQSNSGNRTLSPIPNAAPPTQASPRLAPRPFEDAEPEGELVAKGDAPGHHSLSHLAVTAPIQTKLTIGAPGDPYEQEADRMADQVMAMPDSGPAQVQRMQEPEEEDLQMKPLSVSIQRMQEPEAEELQMKAAGPSQEAGSDLETRLNQAKGGGEALADSARAFIEPRMGFDFSNVRVHTDSAAVQMNEQLGARAFTHGNDIYFGAGQYAPESASGQRLLTHELTHVVQQTGGVLSQLSTSRGIQLDSNPTSPQAPNIMCRGNEHVGGNPNTVTFLPDGLGDALGPGEGGYSQRMLMETGAAAENLMQQGLYSEARLHHILPSLDFLDRQIRARTATHQRYVGLVRGDNSILAPWGIAKELYEQGRDWCSRHIDTMNQQKNEENEKATQFNEWVPVANGFFSSLLRLEAMQNMLGVDNPEAMANALQSGLRDAGEVATRHGQAYGGGRGSTGVLRVPVADATVELALSESNQAAFEMNTAYLGFRQNILDLEIESIDQEGQSDRQRQEEINQVKEFVRNVGRTVDVTASVVSGAPAAITSMSRAVRQGEAMLGAHRNRQQIMGGQRPSHNPTYIDTNDEGELVVRNVQTGMDRPAGGGESTPSPAGPSLSLPSNVSDIMGQIADFAYASEVREINNRLEQIKTRCDSIRGVQTLMHTRERAQNYQDKLNAFALKANAAQNRLAERRSAYLNFGIDLDRFAREDRESRQAGQAPQVGEERYATVITVVGQVREVLAVGQNGKSAIFSADEFRSWAQGIESGRSASPPRTDIPQFSTGEEEWSRLSDIYNQIRTFEQNVDTIRQIFQGVDTSASELMRQVHGGGGSGDY